MAACEMEPDRISREARTHRHNVLSFTMAAKKPSLNSKRGLPSPPEFGT